MVQSDFRDHTNRKSVSSDDDTDEGNDSDESDTEHLTPNGLKLDTSGPEPVYANMALSTDTKPTITVRHIRVLNWPNDSEFPTDYSTLLTLHSEVTECLRTNPKGRILVHCL